MSRTDHHQEFRQDAPDEQSPLLPSSSASASPSASTHHHKDETLGLILMSLSALFFSLMSALVKASGHIFPTAQIVFARSVIQWLLAHVSCIYIFKTSPLGPRTSRPLLVLRGSAGAVGLGAFFFAITHGNLGEATTVFFTGPAFTAVLARVWLGEPLGPLDAASILSCLLGVTLVARPAFLFESEAGAVATPPAAILAALLGALMSATAYVTVRKLGANGAHYMVHVVYFGLVSTLLSGTLMYVDPATRLPASAYEWCLLALVGLCAFGGQILLNRGLQLARAGPGVLMRNLDVVFAYVFGVCVFHEQVFWTSLVGAGLIVGTAVGVGGWKMVRNRKQMLLAAEQQGEPADEEREVLVGVAAVPVRDEQERQQ
ncbi:hypothetical protein BCR44DRAFT_38507 [Catenaria anguillulae PL171]|uniref:EamA domain-containing protein n=1 Tax=Catenaria anguillulae PL171 TaxID=765915 RepID=A0A1Y2HQ37_9FUNG|nr:hypothetical protein BCR44DRAFT_38507 [Catenaria anguillulae PL171]